MNGDHLATQRTLPLTVAIGQSAAALRSILQAHDLCPLDFALKSGIRYVTIWNIMRGNPVRREQAARARVSLWHLTGVWYDGHICVYNEVSR